MKHVVSFNVFFSTFTLYTDIHSHMRRIFEAFPKNIPFRWQKKKNTSRNKNKWKFMYFDHMSAMHFANNYEFLWNKEKREIQASDWIVKAVEPRNLLFREGFIQK